MCVSVYIYIYIYANITPPVHPQIHPPPWCKQARSQFSLPSEPSRLNWKRSRLWSPRRRDGRFSLKFTCD